MTFYIHTYGCQMNVRDSEAVAASLVAAGHTQASDEDAADIVIVNTCSVREKAEEKALGKLGLLCASKRERPRRIIGVMGCMAQRMGQFVFERVPTLDFAVGCRAARLIPGVVADIEVGGGGRRWLTTDISDHDVPQGHLESDLSAFVTVLLGCNRRCSYCIVPDARGPEYSLPAKEIVDEVACLAERGVREVTLLGQSVLNYGRQREPVFDAPAPDGAVFTEPFPRLLEAVAKVPGISRIRFTSGHPSGCTEQLARAFRDIPQVCPHLHLPVQSGSDRILKSMRRGYTAEQYLSAVERLRSFVPDIAITTDIIVGYPGETEEDFEATRELMRKARFDNSFIFKFSPRPGTLAAQMPDDVSAEEKDRRNKVLLADQDDIGVANNALWIGREVEVLAEGPSLRNAERWSGRCGQNKIVIFDPEPGVGRGDLIKVKIVRANPQTLFGSIIV
ncbi:MAG: tRNA (N6-isopentenyl adenosine(37)-C2)-methylthiotransferase MiaB [Kiritimatiellae bacterium]|nr:tRNA (N6-isopentenyl adenosine(37)-C2)-methylthiotransferase MiaB [Kiritimatiellia bacterium]